MLSLAIGFSSCSDKFEVSAPYKDITVVYGLLNMNDSAYYIRIQKAFLDETKSAVDMAKETDSNFYASLEVTMVESDPKTLLVKNTYDLQRVNLDVEGFPKQSGAFFNSPNYAYKVIKPTPDFKFKEYNAYSLRIKNTQTGRIDSSENFMFVNSDSSIAAYGGFYVPRFQAAYMPVTFARTTASGFNYSISGRTPLNARMIEGHIIFHYTDSNAATGGSVKKTADYLFGTDVKEALKQFELKTENAAIVRFLASEIGPAPAEISRYFDSCDIIIYAGSSEMFNYQQITQSQLGGLTGEQIKPIYTNMKGENVMGLIASRAVNTYYNAPIDEETIDSMTKNEMLKPLAIRGRTKD